jgi:ankyrin repeat protein
MIGSLALFGADVNPLMRDRVIPLFAAVSNGHESMACLLASLGADVNTQGFARWTPSMIAAGHCHLVAVTELLRAGPCGGGVAR